MTEQEDIVAPPKPGGTGATKGWWHAIAPDTQAVANFLNRAPRQGAGEAFASNRADGQVDVWILS